MNPSNAADTPRPTIHYRRGGQSAKPTVMLLHGVTRQAADLIPLIDRLQQNYSWIAPDFRGHGNSDRAPGRYRVCDYVADVEQTLRAVDAPQVILIGHSLGAMVAAHAASLWPERIAALVLEDPPFSTMGARLKQSVFYRQFAGMAELLSAKLDAPALYERLRELPVDHPSDGETVPLHQLRSDDAIRTYAEYLVQVDPDVLAAVVDGRWLVGYPCESIFAKIQCPVLLVQADSHFGGMLSQADAESFCRQVAQCQRLPISGAGHLIHASHSDQLADAIQRFLSSAVCR